MHRLRATYTAGETLADDYVYEQLARQHAQASSVQEAASALATAAQDAGDTRNARALNKAALKLAEGVQAVEVVRGEYLIPSGTRDGVIHRVSVTRGCSCEAAVKGFPCWHAALVEIIIAAQPAARLVVTSRYNVDRCVHNVYVDGRFAGATWANWEVPHVAKAYIARTRGAAVTA